MPDRPPADSGSGSTSAVPRRQRVRDATVREITEVARSHLAEYGAADLSLRAVARDLGLAPSALYRYFDSRAALLAALVEEALTEAADAIAVDGEERGDPGEQVRLRWPAFRRWALGSPSSFGLIFTHPHLVEGADQAALLTRLGLLDPLREIASSAGEAEPDATALTWSSALLGWVYAEHFGLLGSGDDAAYAAHVDRLLGAG